MAGAKVDVSWSPVRDDLFLLCKAELNLYQTENLEDCQPPKCQGMKISDETFASLVSTNAEHQLVKCTAWYPKPEPTNLLALGLANGRVVLTSFGKNSSPDPHRLCGKEFVPKHQRQCSYLAWNPVESNLLAGGLERHKQDFSVLIWDLYQLNRAHSDWLHSNDRKVTANYSSEPSMVIQKPFVELGSGETSLSLAWFSHEPLTLVTGMNNKFLRIFDLRDVSRPQNHAFTKAVYGVKVDPLSQHRLASFHETHISIWDTRNFEKPISTLSGSKNILKISWSPTRSGLLACLNKESSVVKLYDIQHSVVADEIEPPSAAERRVACQDVEPISSFDWHPTRENRMLLVSPSSVVRDVQIYERIALTWSPEVYMTWVCSKQLWQAHSIKVCREANEDISTVMRRRAKRGYGVQEDLKDNIDIIGEDPALRNLWSFIHYMKRISTPPACDQPSPISPQSPGPTARPIIGIKSLLCDSVAPQQTQVPVVASSRVDSWLWHGHDGYKGPGWRKVFHSPERLKALELCGWSYCKDSASSSLIDKLEREHHFERAAAIAIFNLKIGRAIQLLNSGASAGQSNASSNLNLSIVAMALSGFSEEKDTMWRDVSSKISVKLKDAYLRQMFSFLTSDTEHYDEIISDLDLAVCDRVAFACLYLPDQKLADYIEKLTFDLILNGDLAGILLTGFTRECLDLLQNYVDRSSDVQTASVVLLQALPNVDLAKDRRVKHWFDIYRDLLDVWRLWHKRAEFDVYRQSCDKTSRGSPWVQPQVFVSCNFCGKSVSFNSLATRSRTFMFGGTAAHKPRVTSCPNCRKPLPRCALCLINMGTSAGGGKGQPNKDTVPETEMERLAKFSDWFTWCQTCRHGGHAEHMTQWYSEHAECPVTGCRCKCASLDAISNSETTAAIQSPS